MSEKDLDTASKIKQAANKLFTEKGFGRTTTRDIANEAGVNLALVNYHFRSKDELFKTIMLETIEGFIGQLQVLMNDDHSFEKKVELVVSNYIELLKKRPDLPLFMLSEIRNHPNELVERLGLRKLMLQGKFFEELAQRCPEGVLPIHLFANLLSMTVFPFIAKPLLSAGIGLNDGASQTTHSAMVLGHAQT
jgi:AcrR family transcriptional regulator